MEKSGLINKEPIGINRFQVEKDILFFAMRYAIGRQTFAPDTVIDNIKLNIELFHINDLKLFIRELDNTDCYGAEFDKRKWINLKNHIELRVELLTKEGS